MSEGWKIRPLGEVAQRRTTRNHDENSHVFTVSAQKGLIRQEDYFKKRIASKNLNGYSLVNVGDYVFNKSYSVDAPFGVIAENKSGIPGLVSPLYLVFGANPEEIVQKYLGIALESETFWQSLEGYLKEGGRAHGALNLKVQDFFSASVPVPPLPEQRRIVDLISSVDSYIEALQQQVQSAKKSRNAVLHELLTVGGDDWVERELSSLAAWRGGITPNMSKPEYWENGDIPWISSGDIANYQENGTKKFVTQKALEETTLKLLPIGSVIVVVRSGILAHSLPVAILTEPATINQDIKVALAHSDVHPNFLWLLLRSNEEKILSSCRKTGTTVQSISMDALLSMKVLIPSLGEQERIFDLISSMDELIGETARSIIKAKTLRSGILFDLLSRNHEIPVSYDFLIGSA